MDIGSLALDDHDIGIWVPHHLTFNRPCCEVDPNRVLLLDVNWTNNSKSTQPQGPRAATKWSLKWMVWLQDCLLSWAALV